jgi:hypothetical protein
VSGPCLWDIDTSCNEDVWNAATPAERERATAYATEVLWALTGRRFGLCILEVRPCQRLVEPTYETYGVLWDQGAGGGWSFMPYLDSSGRWNNLACPGGQCRPASEVWLPGPVAGITEVRINDQVVDSSAYRVDDFAYLVRQDGGSWPVAQDFSVDQYDDAGTFVVTYARGVPVPAAGAAAAGTLAIEFLRACAGGNCRLPARIQSLTRQGVSMQATQTTIKDGLTGLNEVDNWIYAVNPYQRSQPVRVWSPDQDVRRVTTWRA